MVRLPPRSSLTDTRGPYTTRFRSCFDVNRGYDTGAGRENGYFHLHGFDYEQHIVFVDVVSNACIDLQYTRINLGRSEEHTSELQSLKRSSYAVFCLKKKIQQKARCTI